MKKSKIRPTILRAKKHISPVLARAKKHITKRRLLAAGGVLVAVLVAIPIITYAQYSNDISDRERLMNRNSTGIVLRDKNGEVFYEFGKINGNDDVPLSQVSDDFEKALIASEDQNFWTHSGYSVTGIAGAAYANVINSDATRYGGSTITQQLVKNKLLSTEKSYLRKYQELVMAVSIERKYSKQEILEMYINSVYYGEGAFGITDAAKAYFNKKPQDLNLAESSMLVAALPAPTTLSPISGDKEKARQQQERVLGRMVDTNAITNEQRNAALATQVSFNPSGATSLEQAHHFAMMVIDELKQKYGEETITRLGYDVTTTLDLNWQRQAEANARERVNALQANGARNAGVVAIDPTNGHIQTLVGSVDWNNPTFGKVNMATSPRQPGSSFKPIYYNEAIDKKLITAATVLEDKPKTYGGNYAPTNYDFKYRGNITVRNALAQSLNIPAVDVLQKLGVEEATATASRMGITTVNEPQKYGLSLALGTAETKLLDMTNAYAAFAHNGQQYSPTTITGIKDKYNNEVFTYKQPQAKQVTSPAAAYVTSSILSDNQARSPTFGNNLTVPNRTVAVKTGTTNDSKDAWTIGYTPQIVVGVWMGNNENEPMQNLAGSSSAGGVWKSTIEGILGDTPNQDFSQPSEVISAKPCSSSSKEVFIVGSEPKNCNQNKDEKKPTEETTQPEQKREEKPEDQNQKPEPNQEENDTKPKDRQPRNELNDIEQNLRERRP